MQFWESGSAAASHIRGRIAGFGAALVLFAAAGTARAQCVGDCDENCQVSVNELILGVNISLDRQALDGCASFDEDASDSVAVNELVRGVGNALRGCGEDCVSNPSGTRTPTSTATPVESTGTPATATPQVTAPPPTTPPTTATHTGTVIPAATGTVLPTATTTSAPTPEGGLLLIGASAADTSTLRVSFNGTLEQGSGLNRGNYDLIQTQFPDAGGPQVVDVRFALICDGGSRSGQTCNDTHQTFATNGAGACPGGSCSIEDRTQVVLSTTAHAGRQYRLKVTGVRDSAGFPILVSPPPLGTMPRNESFYTGRAPAAIRHCPKATAQRTMETRLCELVLCDPGCPVGDACVERIPDCDGDGLTDDAEAEGWDVVITEGASRICDPNAMPNAGNAKRVTSDPSKPDTDGDGLSDKDEKNSTTARTTSNPRQPDTDLDGLDDYFEAVLWRIDPSNQDCDGDGLPDQKEVTEFLTSPALPDSDADEVGDATDFVQRISDPRFADLPTFEIQVKNPNVFLKGTWEVKQSNMQVGSKDYNETIALGDTSSTADKSTDTTMTEWYAKASAKAEATVGYPWDFSASLTVTAEAGISTGGKSEVTSETARTIVNKFDKTTSSGLQVLTGQTLENKVDGATVNADLLVTNTGPKEISLDDITLRMRVHDPERPGEFITILTLDQKSPTGPIILSTGATSGTDQEAFFEKEIEGRSREFIDSLLRNPRSVIFDVSGFKLKSPSSAAKFYSELETKIIDNTAEVTVDFDAEKQRPLRFFIASNIGSDEAVRDLNGDGNIDEQDVEHVLWQPDPDDPSAPATYLYPRLTEALAMKNILGTDQQVRTMEFTLGSNGHFESIEGVANDPVSRKIWQIIIDDGEAAGAQRLPSLRPEDVRLIPGRRVWVSYVQDEDGDHVPRSVEDVFGSSDNDADSDDDTLTDYDEIYTSSTVTTTDLENVQKQFVSRSNPILADSDQDGLRDDQEKLTHRSAPDRSDSDADGRNDGNEVNVRGSNPLVQNCVAQTYTFDLNTVGTPFGSYERQTFRQQPNPRCSVAFTAGGYSATCGTLCFCGPAISPLPIVQISSTGYETCRIESCSRSCDGAPRTACNAASAGPPFNCPDQSLHLMCSSTGSIPFGSGSGTYTVKCD